MITILRYLLLTGLRDRMFLAMLGGIGLIALAGSFIGDQNVMEGNAATVAYLGFALRLLIVVGIVLFVAVHVRRAFEAREMLLLLSRPTGRNGLVIGYWAGFSVIAAVLVLPAAAAMAWVADPALSGLALWCLSLVLEAMLMVALTLFFALALPGVIVTMLCVIGFYILARMIGVLLAIANSEVRDFTSPFGRGASDTIETMSLFLPRLDLFGRSDWLVYGADDLAFIGLLIAQTLVYGALVLTAALFDFRRRNI